MYRPALTGIHLLTTGECVGDVGALAARYGFPRVAALIERKRRGREHEALKDVTAWEAEFPEIAARLEEAWTRSELPETPPTPTALSEFLVRMRRKYWT